MPGWIKDHPGYCSGRGKAISLWHSGKAHTHSGSVQAVIARSGRE
jgi:hypothetical protein